MPLPLFSRSIVWYFTVLHVTFKQLDLEPYILACMCMNVDEVTSALKLDHQFFIIIKVKLSNMFCCIQFGFWTVSSKIFLVFLLIVKASLHDMMTIFALIMAK